MRDSLSCFHFLRPLRKSGCLVFQVPENTFSRNSSSLLDFAVRDIHNYCIENNMRLNRKKGKEMIVNFMGNPNTIMRPLYIRNQIIQIAWSNH